MFQNSINGKCYIGSSDNLNRRFREYFNINHLLNNKSMYICNSLIKHGYCNFSLTILEYCESDKCIEREKYYIDLLGSEYNIVKDTTIPPMSGRKHSDKTKKIMSDANKGENNTMFGKTGDSHPRFGQPRAEGAGRPSQQIEVTDIKNNTTTT